MKQTFLIKILAMFGLISAFCAPACAEAPALSDYNALLRELRANGIEAGDVRWGEIEKLCAVKRNPSAPQAYNACRYDKAMDQLQFVTDTATCNDQSMTAYPDSLATAARETVTSQSALATTTSTATRPTLTTAEIASGRRQSYDKCMQGKGWRNPRNYKLGRTQ